MQACKFIFIPFKIIYFFIAKAFAYICYKSNKLCETKKKLCFVMNKWAFERICWHCSNKMKYKWCSKMQYKWFIYRISRDKSLEKLTFYRRSSMRRDLSPRRLRFSPCCRTSVGRMRLGTSTSREAPSLDTLVVDKTLSRNVKAASQEGLSRSRSFVAAETFIVERCKLWIVQLLLFCLRKKRRVCGVAHLLVICFCFYIYWRISKATYGNLFQINQSILHSVNRSFDSSELTRDSSQRVTHDLDKNTNCSKVAVVIARWP